MSKIPWKTGLAMAVALIAVLFALTACASESADSARVAQLQADLASEQAKYTSEQAKLESANLERTKAETCYAQVSAWTSETEELAVPEGCFGAGAAGAITSKMTSLIAGLKDEIGRLEVELQSAASRIDLEKQRADETEARMQADSEETSGLREKLAQAQQDLVTFQLESAEKINEGAKTIVDSTVNMTTTRSEISEESGATWLARFDSLEDAHDDLMEQRVQLADERALLDATVAEYVERNTKVERDRLAAAQRQAEARVTAAERRVTAAEETREEAIVARLHAEKESERIQATYRTRLQELARKESEFDNSKALSDQECREAWSRLDAEINNILQKTSLLPPAEDDAERTSRVADIQYKMSVIRGLWSEFGSDCQVSK